MKNGTLLDDMFAGRFDGAAADGVTGLTEQVVAHTPAIVEEMDRSLFCGVMSGLSARISAGGPPSTFLGGDPRFGLILRRVAASMISTRAGRSRLPNQRPPPMPPRPHEGDRPVIAMAYS